MSNTVSRRTRKNYPSPDSDLSENTKKDMLFFRAAIAIKEGLTLLEKEKKSEESYLNALRTNPNVEEQRKEINKIKKIEGDLKKIEADLKARAEAISNMIITQDKAEAKEVIDRREKSIDRRAESNAKIAKTVEIREASPLETRKSRETQKSRNKIVDTLRKIFTRKSNPYKNFK
jgi:hypothetical protein